MSVTSTTLAATYRGGRTTASVALTSLLYVLSLSTATGLTARSSCEKVADVFSKKIGRSPEVPSLVIPDATLSVCHGTLRATGGNSCCTRPMEDEFLLTAPEYLHEHIQMSNEVLKAKITQSDAKFREHLLQSSVETRNQTSAVLVQLFRIPVKEHIGALDSFIKRVDRFFLGFDQHRPEEIVEMFFADLFPSVYQHVLSTWQDASPQGSDQSLDQFKECLTREYSKVEPFGNVPISLGKRLKYAMQRTRVFLESLQVLLAAVEMANHDAHIDHHCAQAVTRLQFCSMCAGQEERKPCRGLCLNVMRGCLSKVAEVSSDWDDLVVAFQNLQLGMFSHHNAQELLAQLDTKVTEAIMKAMDERSRIHAEVLKLCDQPVSQAGDAKTRLSVSEGRLPPGSSLTSSVVPAYIDRAKSVRGDLAQLVRELEDSKGFLLDLPDTLCRVGAIYDQEMDSDQCWNGTAVGRYMNSVPEENMISQVKHNKEVKVTLAFDAEVVSIKEKLVHMRRNLSNLQNDEMMLSDESYRQVDASLGGSGSGYYGSSLDSREVLIDDEDYSYGHSGSGSGDSAIEEEEGEDTETRTENSGPQDGSNIERKSGGPTQRPGSGSRPGQRPPKSESGKGSKPGSGRDSASTHTVSFTLLLATTFASWFFLRDSSCAVHVL